jgi:hypothetical protein
MPLFPNFTNCILCVSSRGIFAAIKRCGSLLYCWSMMETFKLEIPILYPEMGVGDYFVMGGAMIMKPSKGTFLVNPRRLSHYAPFYDASFGLYVCLRNGEIKKKARKLYTSCTSGRHCTADCNQNWQIPRSRRVINTAKFCVVRFNHFGSTRGRISGPSIGKANGPYYIGLRCHVIPTLSTM